MCGIVGFWTANGINPIEARMLARRMATRLTHRGPDDSGEWVDEALGLAIAHRRLSILDRSATGQQPMESPSGRYVLSFNGEIYNHLCLRKCLVRDGFKSGFKGHSDTETLSAGLDQWGLEDTLNRSVGMFALAVWDRKNRVLSLARDRVGEKPLYYGVHGRTFLFGSELKALQVHPEFERRVDEQAMCLYLRHGYIPAPWSIWSGIKKLVPGSVLKVNLGFSNGLAEPENYWTLSESIECGSREPFSGSDNDAINEFDSLLRRAVANQMVADVPLGAFLSGGIDSSSIVALMQAQSSRPVKTYTIGFTESKYDEAIHAAEIAKYLGTDHTELYVSPRQAMSVIPQIPVLYDEPFGDSSAIPTFLVSQLASQHVTVALSGDGGDELLGGYGRYNMQTANRVWRWGNRFRYILTNPIAESMQKSVADAMDYSIEMGCKLTGTIAVRSFRSQLDMGLSLIRCESLDDVYRTTISQWREFPLLDSSCVVPCGPPYIYTLNASVASSLDRMMAMDTLSYLPDDILVKVDRAAMANSLETRIPFLDHRVIEFAWRLPHHLKVRDGVGKYLLRRVLNKYVPQSLFDRPKMGFGVPVAEWLRGPLCEWAADLLSETKLLKYGIFEPRPIRKRWADHLDGRRNWADSLWLVLMFQAWRDNDASTESFDFVN